MQLDSNNERKSGSVQNSSFFEEIQDDGRHGRDPRLEGGFGDRRELAGM